MWTDFALHEDGFGRILVHDIGLEQFEAGRLVQRLLEIETYRMMALVALPLVQEHGPQISLIEEETAKIARGMSEIAGLDDTRALLTRLSRLSADVEGITACLSYRSMRHGPTLHSCGAVSSACGKSGLSDCRLLRSSWNVV